MFHILVYCVVTTVLTALLLKMRCILVSQVIFTPADAHKGDALPRVSDIASGLGWCSVSID